MRIFDAAWEDARRIKTWDRDGSERSREGPVLVGERGASWAPPPLGPLAGRDLGGHLALYRLLIGTRCDAALH
jgi:hypothetical protein